MGKTKLVMAASVLALVAAACGSDKTDAGSSANTTAGATTTVAGGASTSAASGGGTTAPAGPLKKVKLQLQWVTQAQFAGYFAAADQGYYKAFGLDVELMEAGTDTVPQQVLADGQADFALAWVPKALASREAGADIINIGQVFQRSGTLQVSFKEKNIASPTDFKGKKIGNWGFGNEFEVFAGITKVGLDPAKDVSLVQQDFNMKGLLSGDIDAAEAMTYNEYAQVLEAKNPKTGSLYTPADFNVVAYNDVGVGMLQDAVWADGKKIKSDAAYQDTATKFLTASFKGWAYCRDNAQKCADIVVAHNSKLGASHQLWQMNEVNKLVWPSPKGIGILDTAAWDQTVKIAQGTKNLEGKTVLTKDPGVAYDMTYAQAAVTELKAEGVDVNGTSFKPVTVTLKEGGS
jgi:NitT/TauT family transport system substrate-binding protein